MSLTLKPAPSRGAPPSGATTRRSSEAFTRGSWLNGKHAALMILLCAPALLFSAMLTVPALLFQSPQHQGYYYFSQVVNQDPSRWIIYAGASVCALLALIVPVTGPRPMAARGR